MNVLEATYVAFRLQPFYRNIGKRLVKTPKIYFYDVGLVCYLLGIQNAHQLETHPLRGQIFENMVVTEILKHRLNHGLDNNLFFYRDRSQYEVDVVLDDSLSPPLNPSFTDLDDSLLSVSAFEIKLSPTIHNDFYKSLKYFKALFEQETVKTQIINTGTDKNGDSFTGHFNYRDIESQLNQSL